MTELRLPCAEGNPDDWFVGRDGKQYPDEDYLTDDDRLAILEAADASNLEGPARINFIERAQDRAEQDARTAGLRRRRHARDACHAECLFRTRCLDQAIREGHAHGIWGGYYEDEIRAIRLEIERRKRNST